MVTKLEATSEPCYIQICDIKRYVREETVLYKYKYASNDHANSWYNPVLKLV